MTHIPDDAVHWDSGDWIEWHRRTAQSGTATIGSAIDRDAKMQAVFQSLLRTAQLYHQLTRRHLPVYDAMAELLGAMQHGLHLHDRTPAGEGQLVTVLRCLPPYACDSTISLDPGERFDRLLMVRFTPEFQAESRMVPRDALPVGEDGRFTLCWTDLSTSA